jgi:hypothetical protein
MQTSTLKDINEKLGQTELGRRLGVSRQHIENYIKRNSPIFIEHDDDLNIKNAYLKKGFGRFKR